MPFNTFALLKVIGMIKCGLQMLVINSSNCKYQLAGLTEIEEPNNYKFAFLK